MKKIMIIAWILLLASTYSNAQTNTWNNGKVTTCFEPLNSNNDLKIVCRKKVMPAPTSFNNYSLHTKKIENTCNQTVSVVRHNYYHYGFAFLYPGISKRFSQIDVAAPKFAVAGTQHVNLTLHTEYLKSANWNTDDGSGINIRLSDNTSLNMGIDDYEGMPNPIYESAPVIPDSNSMNGDNDLDISLSLFVTIH